MPKTTPSLDACTVSQAYDQGRAARQQGKQIWANPHLNVTLIPAWRKGFNEAPASEPVEARPFHVYRHGVKSELAKEGVACVSL